jgi:hypothetical protein
MMPTRTVWPAARPGCALTTPQATRIENKAVLNGCLIFMDASAFLVKET